jgi:hypothetical protein
MGGDCMEIKLTLPIYHSNKKKSKSGKTFLLSLNWYRNSYHYEKNKVKKEYQDLIAKELEYLGPEDKMQEYKIKYVLFYRNGLSDAMNVISVVDKFFQDALQELGIVENDTVKNCKKITVEVGGYSRSYPRVEITVEKIK